MSLKKLILREDLVCGRPCFYPHNDASKILLELFKSSGGKRKVFNSGDISKLESLGYEIKIVKPKVTYE